MRLAIQIEGLHARDFDKGFGGGLLGCRAAPFRFGHYSSVCLVPVGGIPPPGHWGVVLTPSSAFGARSTWSLDTLVTSRCHFLVRMPWQAFCKPAKPPPILRVCEEVAAHALSGASFVSEKDIAHDHLMGLHASLVNAIMLPSGFIFANSCRPLCIVELLMKLAGGLLCSQWWHTDASPLPVPIPVALSPPCGQSWS